MKKRFVSILLCAATCFGGVACSKENNKGVAKGEYTVSYARSTVTVIADSGTVGKEKGLIFSGVKNEYESAQVLLSAKTEVSGISLQTENLSCGEKTLSKENFTVYGENCYLITELGTDPTFNKTQEPLYQSPYPEGIYPDGLIPQDLWVEAEENVIPAGQTRGLWVSLYIPKDTVAGVYTGNFTLSAGGKTQIVPVEVTVYDYTLPDENTMRSLFLMRNDYTFNYGELDSTVEMQRKYYDFLLDYRINAYNVPIESYDDVNYFVESIKEYYDNPKVSTYGLPASTRGNGSVPSCFKAKEQVLGLAAACEEGKNYISKLVIKNGDETDLNASYASTTAEAEAIWKADIQNNKNVQNTLLSAANEIRNDTGKYAGFIANYDSVEDAAKAIEEIPIVDPMTSYITYYEVEKDQSSFAGQLHKTLDIWCPISNVFSPEYIDTLYDAAEDYDIQEMWWYTANGPNYPLPTYHIDNNPLGARLMSWMQRDYDIVGNLYWAVAYTEPGKSIYEETDYPAADGCLLYPGKKYGYDGPLPSMRLERIRDGVEEYELLGLLEEKLRSYANAKSTSIDVDAFMDTLYNRLYFGVQTYDDASVFDGVREEMLALLTGDLSERAIVTNVQSTGNKASVTVYAEKAFTTQLSCESVGNNLYEVEVPLINKDNYLVGKLDGKDISLWIAKGQNSYEANNNENVTVTEGSSSFFENGELNVTIVGKLNDSGAVDNRFFPKATIPMTAFGKEALDVSNARVLTVKLRNTSSKNIKVYLYVRSDSDRLKVREITLPSGGREIPVTIRVDLENWSKMNNLTGLDIELLNEKAGDNASSTTLALTGLEVLL